MKTPLLIRLKMTVLLMTLGVLAAVDAGAADEMSWWRRVFSELTWAEVADIRTTPKQICSAVRHRVRYKADEVDEWQAGEETWNKRVGDCEDFAIAITELCRKNGIDAEVMILNPKNSWEGHAVAVGIWKDRFWVSSNGWYEECASLDDVKRKIAHEFRWRNRAIDMFVAKVPENGRNQGYPETAANSMKWNQE